MNIVTLHTQIKKNKSDFFSLNYHIFMSQEAIDCKACHQFNNFPGGKGKQLPYRMYISIIRIILVLKMLRHRKKCVLRDRKHNKLKFLLSLKNTYIFIF